MPLRPQYAVVQRERGLQLGGEAKHRERPAIPDNEVPEVNGDVLSRFSMVRRASQSERPAPFGGSTSARHEAPGARGSHGSARMDKATNPVVLLVAQQLKQKQLPTSTIHTV